jgi:hypothetical protein
MRSRNPILFVFVLLILVAVFVACCQGCVSSLSVNERTLAIKLHENGRVELVERPSKSETALVYFASEDSQLELRIYDLVNRFERMKGCELAKYMIGPSNQIPSPDWIVLNGIERGGELLENKRGCDLFLFRDGSLFRCFSSTSITQDRLWSSLHLAAFRFNDEKEYIETNRPEDYIDVAELYRAFMHGEESTDIHLMLYLANPYVLCGEKHLLRYFDDLLKFKDRYSGLIILDESFGPADLDLIAENLQVITSLKLLPPYLAPQFARLGDANYHVPTNILFFYGKSGEFLGSYYIWNDCSSLLVNF